MNEIILFFTKIFVDFNVDFVCKLVEQFDFDITLLWKERCLQKWKNQFVDLNFNFIRFNIIILNYSFMMTRDVDNCILNLSNKNYLREFSDQISHKVYNLIKDLTIIIIKDLNFFDNLYFEKLIFTQNELIRWHRVNRREVMRYFFFENIEHENVHSQTLKGRQLTCWSQSKHRHVTTF